MASIEEKIETIIQKPIEELGYELYDVQYAKEGKDYFLRIFIDKPSGISLEDCEKVSNEINTLLDEKDYIKEQYFLEVSSTGIEKVLRKNKHLQDNLGQEVEIKLFKPLDKKRELIGILQEFNENIITIKLEEENVNIERKNIALIKKKYNWE